MRTLDILFLDCVRYFNLPKGNFYVMNKVLKPARFDIRPNAPNAAKLWRHWLATFENFLETIEQDNLSKLTVFTNYVSADVYELFLRSCQL